MKLDIYRNNAVVAVLPVSENSSYTHQLMGEHKIVCNNIIVPDVLDIQLGDYVLYAGEKYFINTAPGMTKHHNFRYEYQMEFEHVSYRLFDKKLMQNGEFVTDYFGYPRLYLQLITENMNQIDSGWQVGEVETMDEKHIAFEDGVSCRAALTIIAEQFGLEYYFTGKTIHLVKSAGLVTSHVFSQGKGKGLYTFQLQRRNDANVVTRVYGYGGNRNIPADYRLNAAGIPAERIRIPSGYLEQNVELYGIKEAIYKNDEIFPRRTAPLTGVGGVTDNVFYVTDTTLEFNINDHLLEGLDAKVDFKTGDLAGYEFTISKFDNSSKTFTLNVDKNQPDRHFPNADFMPKAGDKYTLVDLRMPQEYVVAAEAEVNEETAQYTAENSRPKLVFSLNLDDQYVRAQGVRLTPGDRVRVVEEKLGVDSMIRTTSVTWPLLHEDRIAATIADFIPYTRQERLISETIETRRDVVINERINAERARRTAAELRLLRSLIQDPDGYFDMTQQLKPGSIETLFLAVGAKSQNFGLNNVLIQANYRGNPDAVHISAGQLVHYEVQIEGLGYVWQMPERLFEGLDPNKAYYIAAKVERTALRGVWSLTEDFKAAEQEPGVWYFNLGVLYPVKDGYRNYDLTKGMTTIVGETITTGKVQSIDKINFFNLTNGTFNLGDETNGLDWGVTKEGQLTIRGAALADKFMVGSGGVVNAYISGLTDNGPLSVRFSAGENGEFRVLDNGTLYASKLNAQGGKIGAFEIEGMGLTNTDGKAFLQLGDKNSLVRLGPGIFQSSEGRRGSAHFWAKPDTHHVALTSEGHTRLEGSVSYGTLTTTTSSFTIPNDIYTFVVYKGQQNADIYLPRLPNQGQVVYVLRRYGVRVRVHGNGFKIIRDGRLEDWRDIGHWGTFVHDGSYWHLQ